jgi:beta-lactamase superfamily II metal-dependent hydrolase
VALLCAVLGASSLHATELLVIRNARLYSGPSSLDERIRVLHPPERLDLLDPEATNNYLRVRTHDDETGWVYRHLVAFQTDTDEPPTASASGTPARPDAPPVSGFQIHFLDVGTGDAAIVDMGDREIVIDGGESVSVLHDYAARTGIIDGPIELVVVTHADSDHWKGLRRLLGFDGTATTPHTFLEFWEPGYDRICRPLASYDAFIADVGASGARMLRPLENSHPSAVATGRIDTFGISSVPGVAFTVLHTDATPASRNGDCGYLINNASIVLRLEIDGVRFLFTGDANGKERVEASPGTPGHIEEQLLDLERDHPGILRADVLKVPHHGSETASTQAFIDAVAPSFAVISASTRHELPRESVVDRYADGSRVVLRTDAHHDADVDHVVCGRRADRQFDCTMAEP